MIGSTTNRRPFGAKSIGKLQLESKFSLHLQDSQKIFLCIFDERIDNYLFSSIRNLMKIFFTFY